MASERALFGKPGGGAGLRADRREEDFALQRLWPSAPAVQVPAVAIAGAAGAPRPLTRSNYLPPAIARWPFPDAVVHALGRVHGKYM
ncbi:MAG: hypothetical protein MUC60_07970 [Oscillatoria sp. Prado101]|nr:hypothetical protein [Oscillatoria sp. Prado101]